MVVDKIDTNTIKLNLSLLFTTSDSEKAKITNKGNIITRNKLARLSKFPYRPRTLWWPGQLFSKLKLNDSDKILLEIVNNEYKEYLNETLKFNEFNSIIN